MTPPATRDPEVVLAGFGRWLRAQEPAEAPEVVRWERPDAGFSSETLLVDVRSVGLSGPVDQRLVLKLAPPGPGGFPTYDLPMQARVQEAVAAAGVPAPVPARAEADPRWVGEPFLVMPAVSGHIVDQVPLSDRWLTTADPALAAAAHRRYLDVVADINRIELDASGLRGAVPERDNAAELAYWRDYLAWYGDGVVLVPALVEALEWCTAHRPPSDPPPSLRWGDVRLGNVIFDETRTPVAVLDWEMAAIGAAEHDLAWALGIEAIQAELLGRTVAGFLDHEGAVAHYEERLGRPVQDLDWYEILAMIRSTAVMTRLSHLHEATGQPALFPLAENPILGILARRIERYGT